MLSLAASGLWLRCFRLREYRSNVRNIKGFRSASQRSAEAWNLHHHGFCDESHVRQAQVVHRFRIIEHLAAQELVYVERRQRPRPATEQLAVNIRSFRLEVRS